MGFGNGYDSGYSDALEDVRSGKVAGLGPASGDGGGGAVPTARTAGLFYITGDDETLEIEFITPMRLSGGNVDAVELQATFTFTSTDDGPLAHVAAPNGGWVPGDAIMFYHNNSSLAGIDRGDTASDDPSCANLNMPEVDMVLLRLADTWTLLPLGSFE